MARALPCLAGLALLLTYGVAEGLMNHRWTPSAELEQAAARLPDVPRAVGAWEGGEDEAMGPRELAIAQLKGYLIRRYVHRESRGAVHVRHMCGRGGEEWATR